MANNFLDNIINEANAVASSGDRLERVKDVARQVRSLEVEREQLEERLSTIKRQLQSLLERDLVKVLGEAAMTSFSLERDGNLPALTFEKVTYYSAKIPEDKEVEAFGWLHDEGHGDLVKTQISVALGMGDRELAQQVENAITEAGADFSSKLSVHPATLKSFVKTEVEAGRALPLELFGAHIGETVKIKKGK